MSPGIKFCVAGDREGKLGKGFSASEQKKNQNGTTGFRLPPQFSNARGMLQGLYSEKSSFKMKDDWQGI